MMKSYLAAGIIAMGSPAVAQKNTSEIMEGNQYATVIADTQKFVRDHLAGLAILGTVTLGGVVFIAPRIRKRREESKKIKEIESKINRIRTLYEQESGRYPEWFRKSEHIVNVELLVNTLAYNFNSRKDNLAISPKTEKVINTEIDTIENMIATWAGIFGTIMRDCDTIKKSLITKGANLSQLYDTLVAQGFKIGELVIPEIGEHNSPQKQIEDGKILITHLDGFYKDLQRIPGFYDSLPEVFEETQIRFRKLQKEYHRVSRDFEVICGVAAKSFSSYLNDYRELVQDYTLLYSEKDIRKLRDIVFWKRGILFRGIEDEIRGMHDQMKTYTTTDKYR